MVEPLAVEDETRPLAERFRRVAAAVPERIAIADGDLQLSYAALDEWSDRVAALVPAPPANAPHHVALLLPHAALAPVALLAAAKAGAVFVPLDATWPAAHRDALLHDAAARTVLTDAAGAAGLGEFTGTIVRVDDAPPARAPRRAGATDAAAIYYSSGSTGRPKGVLLPHRSLLAEARRYARTLDVTPNDRLVWLSPLASGASKLPILGALLSGSTLLPYAVGTRGVGALAAWMNAERVTIWSSVPSLFRRFAESLPAGRHCPALRAVKLGGEAVLATDAALFASRFGDACVLWNGLGISETAGNVCFYRWDRAPLDEPTVPLGRAVDGLEVTLVDEAGAPVANGDAGEIVVRAPHLALGYWNLPELTAERFRTGSDGARRFFTGDLAARDAAGNLVGRGRKDGATKIRGHRVDPAAVDVAVRGCDGVADAVTVVRSSAETDGAKLVTFLVASTDAPPPNLRATLARRLPSHMVPSQVIALPALPRLPSGKVDRHRLSTMPLPERDDTTYVAPRDALERQLAHIWAKALRLPRVGVADDFFELGGDSLDAVRICAMIERWLRVNLPLTEIAKHPTVAALAAAIRAHDAGVAQVPVVLLNAGDDPLPFFCVPGAGSDAFALLPLAHALGAQQTFYALQYPGLDGSRPSLLTLEAMAARVLPHILAVQPTGPYCLGGTSFGGMVAFEIARQLRARGETVALLALIETYGRDYPPVRLQSIRRDLPRLLLRWLLPIGVKNEPATFERLRLGVRDRLQRVRARLDLALPWRTTTPPYALRFTYLQEICFVAHRRYAFPSYDGPVVLFRTEEQPPATLYALSDDMGWKDAARGGIEIEEIPGYHGVHIQEPHVHGLAAKLGARLRAAAAGVEGRFYALLPRSRALWDDLGTWWDEQIGDDGNPGSRDVLPAAVDRLLAVRAGERVLDAGCGNGWYGRRLARAGAAVMGFDFSAVLIERARTRAADAGLSIDHRVIDAARRDDLLALGERTFDAAVCLMALMDMANVEPLFAALARLVKPGGRVVFSMVHPEHGALARAQTAEPLTGIGLPGQPTSHYYFHRPLPLLLRQAADAGLTLDAREDVVGADGAAYVVARLCVR